MTDKLDSAAIRAQMEALDGHTPGPLHIRTLENFGWNIVHYRGGSLNDFLRVAKAALEQDARLIAAAPDMHATILTLCDEVDRLRAENELLRAMIRVNSLRYLNMSHEDIDAAIRSVLAQKETRDASEA